MTGPNFITVFILLFLAVGIAAYWSKLTRDTESLKANPPRNPEEAESPMSNPAESAAEAEPGSPVLPPAVAAFFVAVVAVLVAIFTGSIPLAIIAGILVGVWWLVLVTQTWLRVRAEIMRAAKAAAENVAPADAPAQPNSTQAVSAPAVSPPAPVAEVQALREEVAQIAARVHDAPSQAAPDIAPEIALLRHEIAALSTRTEESDVARARQMQPELLSLRGEIADLANMIARSQWESQIKPDAAPDIEALRKELAALSAQVQAAASLPPQPAATVVRLEKGPWLLRPLPAGLIATCIIAVTYLAAAGPEMREKFIRFEDAPRFAATDPAVTAQVAPVNVAPVVTPPGSAKPETRIALVIGNSGYKNVPRLANPARDADSIVASLKRIGFQSVSRHADLGHAKMNEVLRSFAVETEKADWAVVYFAGHGLEIAGVNYLIPVDARLASDNVVPLEAISLDNVMSAVVGARKLRMVLLDACRDNPFVAQMKRSLASRSVGRGLGRIEPEAGTLVVFAAKHGEVALDGSGQNSPFAASLAKRILTPGLDVRRLFDLVRDDVLEATARKQQPFTYGSLPGREDFYFVSAK
jgi:hypothetical protein